MDRTERAIRLRELREARGLTQNGLAKRARMSASHLNRLEKGDRPLSEKIAKKLASAIARTPAEVDNVLVALGFRVVEDTPTPPTPAHLPSDPLAVVEQALQAGPWPERVRVAVVTLLAAVLDTRSPLGEQGS